MSTNRRRPGEPTHAAASRPELPAAARPARGLVPLLLLVIAATLVTHWPVLSSNALWLDDNEYVVDNPLVRNPSWHSAGLFLTEVLRPSTVSGYYQPLTMISLMADYATGGEDGSLRPYHRTNLVLHALNAALVALFLYLLFGQSWVAAMLGVLFGCHPMTVETVAWLAERKTLLATFFALMCLIFYVLHTRRRSWKLYTAALLTFVLALLSKPTTTPLPLLLLLLDYWPLRRLSVRTLVEKVPFLVIAGVSAVITYVSQAEAGTVTLPQQQSPLTIPLILCHNILFYPFKMIWPTQLTSHHPFPEPFNLSQPMVLAGVIATALLVPILFISWRWTRALLVGWLFFFVAIFPTLGVIGFTNTIAGYKYAYLPAVGFLMILAALFGRLWQAPTGGRRVTPQRIVLVLLVAVAGVLEACGAQGFLSHWSNTESLYRYQIPLAPRSAVLYNNLGVQLSSEGRDDEAAELYLQALAVDPTWHSAHNNLGKVRLKQHRVAEAVQHFEQALRIKPDYFKARANLGVTLMNLGRLDDAHRHLEQAVELCPWNALARSNLAAVLIRLGQYDLAAGQCREALRRDPGSFEVHYNLADAEAGQGHWEQAAEQYRYVIRIKPGFVRAYLSLANSLLSQGRIDEAIGVYEEGLRANPGDTALADGLRRATRLRDNNTTP